ncbi:MAG: chromate transporter [bacterium]|nr:chromate transporter [bacterium]
MKQVSLFKLFFLFAKFGAIALGGGFVILPIIKRELVDKRNLISNNDLMDYFALSQSLPGIIAANISLFTGYKLRGILGALVAMFGVVFVPFWAIVIIATFLSSISGNSYVQGIFWGVGVAVIALIILTARDIWRNAKRNLFFYIIFLLALVSLLILNFSPIKTIITLVIVGVLYKRFEYVRREGK